MTQVLTTELEVLRHDVAAYRNDYAVEQRKRLALQAVLHTIAAFDDKGASERLKQTGSYSSFDEPCAVQAAREALTNL